VFFSLWHHFPLPSMFSPSVPVTFSSTSFQSRSPLNAALCVSPKSVRRRSLLDPRFATFLDLRFFFPFFPLSSPLFTTSPDWFHQGLYSSQPVALLPEVLDSPLVPVTFSLSEFPSRHSKTLSSRFYSLAFFAILPTLSSGIVALLAALTSLMISALP